jgi:hypothetical protein
MGGDILRGRDEDGVVFENSVMQDNSGRVSEI